MSKVNCKVKNFMPGLFKQTLLHQNIDFWKLIDSLKPKNNREQIFICN